MSAPPPPYQAQAPPVGTQAQGAPPPGAPNAAPYQPPPGQAQYPSQQYHYGPPQGQAPAPGQPQQPYYPGQAPHNPPYVQPPAPGQQPGYYGQPPAPGGPQYGQQQPPGPYGAPSQLGAPYEQSQNAPYGQPPPGVQQPPYGQQAYAGQPPQQWGQHPQAMPPYGAYIEPAAASAGYDPAQKNLVQPVDTSTDVETLRKAMKGMGCDEKALIRVFTSPKYANPWSMAKLVQDYNSRFIRDLAKDIESETRGNLETALLALLRGPLEHDVRVLDKALNRLGTDEEALNDVLLCRSNADLRAIAAEYKRVKSRDLLAEIKDDVDDNLFRLYSMVLSATRAEEKHPIVPAEIDHKATELQRATEGTIGANAIAVAQVFTSSSDPQIRAIAEAYQSKYHRALKDVIEKEFRGDMEDALLRMLESARNRAEADAERLRQPLLKSGRQDRLFINRIVSLYWDRERLDNIKAAYLNKYRRSLARDVKDALSGDYEDLILALIGEK